jgi:hypothetical protein
MGGSSVREPVLREFLEILGQQGVGDQSEDVADAVGEVLHELVLLEVGLAQNIGTVFFDQCVERREFLFLLQSTLSALQRSQHRPIPRVRFRSRMTIEGVPGTRPCSPFLIPLSGFVIPPD